jgi:hypothetical protein
MDKEFKDELEGMDCASLLYGALISFTNYDDRSEAIMALTVLVDKLKQGAALSKEDVISVVCAVEEDIDGNYEEGSDEHENFVEFEIKTTKDEDPKKRWN